MLGFLPEMSIDDMARRELNQGDIDQYGTGFDETKRGAFNWQDQLGAYLAGGTKEEVLARAAEIRNKKLSNTYNDKGARTRNALTTAGLTPSYKGVEGLSTQQIEDLQMEDEGRLAAFSTLTGMKGFTPDMVSGNAGVQNMNSIASRLLNAEAGRIENKKDERYATEQRRLDLQEQRIDAERADRYDLQAQQLGLQRDKLFFDQENLKADRQFNRDQMHKESMMQLFAGLTNMGGLFNA